MTSSMQRRASKRGCTKRRVVVTSVLVIFSRCLSVAFASLIMVCSAQVKRVPEESNPAACGWMPLREMQQCNLGQPRTSFDEIEQSKQTPVAVVKYELKQLRQILPSSSTDLIEMAGNVKKDSPKTLVNAAAKGVKRDWVKGKEGHRTDKYSFSEPNNRWAMGRHNMLHSLVARHDRDTEPQMNRERASRKRKIYTNKKEYLMLYVLFSSRLRAYATECVVNRVPHSIAKSVRQKTGNELFVVRTRPAGAVTVMMCSELLYNAAVDPRVCCSHLGN